MSRGETERKRSSVLFALFNRFPVGFAEWVGEGWFEAESRRFYNGLPSEEQCEFCGSAGAFVCDCYAPALSYSGDSRISCDAVLCSQCAIRMGRGLHACPPHAEFAASTEGAAVYENRKVRHAEDARRRNRPPRQAIRLVWPPPKRKPPPKVALADIIPLRQPIGEAP